MHQQAISRVSRHFTEGPPPKVYSYARWSTPEQAQGDTFRRQADAAERWATRMGLSEKRRRCNDDGKNKGSYGRSQEMEGIVGSRQVGSER